MHTSRTLLVIAVLLLNGKLLNAQGPVFNAERIDQISSRLSSPEAESLNDAFNAWEMFSLDASPVHAHMRDSGSPFTLMLGNAHAWPLALELHDLRSSDFVARMATHEGDATIPFVQTSTYKGHVLVPGGGRARFSIRPDALMGNLVIGDEEYFLEPLWQVIGGEADDRYVVYRLSDVIADADAHCGVTDMHLIEEAEGDDGMRGGNPCRLARIALAADGSMVTFLGSAAAVQTRMLDILNWVDGKYQEPAVNIAYQVVAIYISSATAQDPWSASQDAITLLNSFVSWGNGGGFGPGINYAVASLWTRRDIQSDGSSGTIGLAYVSVVCTSNRYNLCEHYTTSMAGPTIVQTHELGHNWSAQHTTTAGQWIMAPTASTANVNWDATTINSIVAHKNTRTCLVNSCLLSPVVDFMADATATCSGTVSFIDQSTNQPVSWLWNFGDGNSSTLQNPVHTYTANGNYTVQLTATNATGSGVETKTSYISVDLLPVPNVISGVVCEPGGVVDLSASGTGNLLWYTGPFGGEPVHTGGSFAPDITTTTTWYVENSTQGPILNAGPVSNTIGTGGNFNSSDSWGLYFDVLAPMQLLSAKAYASGAGSRTVQVLNNSGALVESRTVNVPAGESRITLDIELPVGTQYLIKISGTVNLYRNDAGAVYPYSAPGLVSITGTNATGAAATTYYYFFYDWEVREAGCASARVPVTGVVEVCAGLTDASTGLLRVFPNPTDGDFTVSIDPSVSAAAMEVHDALGRVVERRSVLNEAEWRVQIRSAAGLYHVRLLAEDGTLLAAKRIVMREP
ncbi:MAG: PKD domain-containing protein [Flavobacteriales bacterium]